MEITKNIMDEIIQELKGTYHTSIEGAIDTVTDGQANYGDLSHDNLVYFDSNLTFCEECGVWVHPSDMYDAYMCDECNDELIEENLK